MLCFSLANPSIATKHYHTSLIFLSTAQFDSDFYSIEANASLARNGKELKEAASDSGKA